MAANYKEYLDDALFTKNLTVTYKMLSFKEKISNVIAQQALEAYMKENSERVCGLYLTKPSDSTFALKSSDEISADQSSDVQHICHIYSISTKSGAEEENGTEKSIRDKTWESDKTHVFAPLLTTKSVVNVAENPLLSSSFSSIAPPTEDEIKMKLRPVYPHDPVPTHITKTVSTPSVKVEKPQSVETHVTKSKTSDLGSMFAKSAAKSTVKKTSTNQLSFGSSSSSSLTPSTVSAVSSSSSVASKAAKTSSAPSTPHKPKLKRLRKQIDDEEDDENGGNEDEDLEEDDDDGFFDDIIDNDDNGFLDDGNDDDILLPVKHENSNHEVKNPVQESRPAPVVHHPPVSKPPPPQQPPKKKPAASKKKSSSGGTQTSIASFFCAKK